MLVKTAATVQMIAELRSMETQTVDIVVMVIYHSVMILDARRMDGLAVTVLEAVHPIPIVMMVSFVMVMRHVQVVVARVVVTHAQQAKAVMRVVMSA